MNDLIRRKNATQETLAAYRGTVFDWEAGATCVHLARDHMMAMGHVVQDIPGFKTPIGAMRALKKRGWSSVADMLDDLLERRPGAASMLLGDLALIKGADGLDAIFICAGPLKVFGWRDDMPDLVLLDVSLGDLEGAWKV